MGKGSGGGTPSNEFKNHSNPHIGANRAQSGQQQFGQLPKPQRGGVGSGNGQIGGGLLGQADTSAIRGQNRTQPSGNGTSKKQKKQHKRR